MVSVMRESSIMPRVLVFSNLYLTKINWVLETLALDNFYIKRAQWYSIKCFKNDFKFCIFQSIGPHLQEHTVRYQTEEENTFYVPITFFVTFNVKSNFKVNYFETSLNACCSNVLL